MKLKLVATAVLVFACITSPLYVKADISLHAANYRIWAEDSMSLPFLVKSDVSNKGYHSSKTEIALAAYSDVAQADFFEDETDVSGDFFNDSVEKASKKQKAPVPETSKTISVEFIPEIKDVVVEKKQENLPSIEAVDEIETLEKVASEEVEKKALPTETVLHPIKSIAVKDVKIVEEAPSETLAKDTLVDDELTIEGLRLPVPVSVVPMHFIEDGIEGYSNEDYPSEAMPAGKVDSQTFAPIKVGSSSEEGKIICVPLNKSLLVDPFYKVFWRSRTDRSRQIRSSWLWFHPLSFSLKNSSNGFRNLGL